jgi:hypothetical protein
MKEVRGFSAIVPLLAIVLAAAWSGSSAKQKVAVSKDRKIFSRLPVAFEPNRGQTDQRVKYMAKGSGFRLFLTQDEAVIAMQRREAAGAPFTFKARSPGGERIQEAVLRMRLENANRQAQITPGRRLPGRVNYLIGHDSRRWQRGLPIYGEVAYRNVYPGVDVVYHAGERESLEYDFVVAPRANPQSIRLDIAGADRLSVTKQGDLMMVVGGSRLLEHRPTAYQTVGNHREPVDASYVVSGNQVGIRLGSYDSSRTLVIDPVLTYASYLGGSGLDFGSGVFEDGSGNIFLAGETSSADFPTTTGAFQTALSGTDDAFVSKIAASGGSLIYSTYVGGSKTAQAIALTVDHDHAIVVGTTDSGDFPVTADAFQPTFAGVFDGFVTKLNENGDGLSFSSFIGGADNDLITGVAVDSAGNLYLAGGSASTDFPVTPGAFQTVYGGGLEDGVLAKVETSTGALVYASYLGGSAEDDATAIAVDRDDNAYLTGETFSSNFPVTPGAFQTSQPGTVNAFVTKMNPSGSDTVFSTYLGGSSRDAGRAIALSPHNPPYISIAGQTTSSDFPTMNPTQATIGGNDDAFETEMVNAGDALFFSTFLGGSDFDRGHGVKYVGANSVVLTGDTFSTNFPTKAAIQDSLAGTDNAFLTELNVVQPRIISSTYFGGSGSTAGRDVFVTSDLKQVLFAGVTNSNDLATTDNAVQKNFGGGTDDAFVARVKLNTQPPESHSVSGPNLTSTSFALFLIGAWIAIVMIRRRTTRA